MDNSGHQDFSSYNYSQEIQNTLARAEMINNMNMNIGPGDSSQNAYARAEMNNNVDMNLGPGGLGSGPQFSVQSVDLEKQKSLEKTCESLQTQVLTANNCEHNNSEKFKIITRMTIFPKIFFLGRSRKIPDGPILHSWKEFQTEMWLSLDQY